MYKINKGNKGKENLKKHYIVFIKVIINFVFKEDVTENRSLVICLCAPSAH